MKENLKENLLVGSHRWGSKEWRTNYELIFGKRVTITQEDRDAEEARKVCTKRAEEREEQG